MIALQTLLDRSGEGNLLPADLAEWYGGSLVIPSPRLYANFVSSIDGVVAIDEHTPPSVLSGKSEADRFVMGLLRAMADAVLVGAGTARTEQNHLWTPGFIFEPAAKMYSAVRVALGMDPTPRTFLITRSGNIDPSMRVLRHGAAVVAPSESAAELRRTLPKTAEVIPMQQSDPDVADILRVVRSHGYQRILTEGGPRVLAQFLQKDLLDELFLTLSPRVAGRDDGFPRLGLVEGAAFEPNRLKTAELFSVKAHGSHIFLRYLFAR